MLWALIPASDVGKFSQSSQRCLSWNDLDSHSCISTQRLIPPMDNLGTWNHGLADSSRNARIRFSGSWSFTFPVMKLNNELMRPNDSRNQSETMKSGCPIWQTLTNCSYNEYSHSTDGLWNRLMVTWHRSSSHSWSTCGPKTNHESNS
jgi:hypothetical protein